MSQNFELLNQIEADAEFGKFVPKAIPKTPKVAWLVRDELFTQELLGLAQTIFISQDAKAPHVVVLCGVDSGSGSSEICMELGRILAAYSAGPVCIVDANLRSLRLSGLADITRPMTTSSGGVDKCEHVAPNLWLATIDVLTQEHDSALAPANQLKQRVAKLRSSFTYVVIDAPEANTRGDAAALGQLADGTILVLEANSTRKAAALRAKTTLESMNVRLLGTVLHGRTFPIPEPLYRKL